MEKRISKDEYYLNIAKEVAQRSTCFRAKIGVVILRGDQIVATGYIGAPRKTKDCLERGECLRDKLKIPHGKNYEICRSVHAEQNVIVQAALHGISTRHSTVYCTCSPCIICAKMLINAQISRFVACKEYPDDGYKSLFNEANIIFDALNKNRSLF